MKPLTILTIDDHSVVRMGLKVNLEDNLEGCVVDGAERFLEALEMLSEKEYDVVILDIGIPGGGTPNMIGQIKKIQPKVPVLIYTTNDDAQLALRYLQAGATGYLTKCSSSKQVIEAINSVLKDTYYINYQTQQYLLTALANHKVLSRIPKGKKLSVREQEIAELLAQGKWTNEISEMLGLKANTISTVKGRIYQKLGVSNTIELYLKLNEINSSFG